MSTEQSVPAAAHHAEAMPGHIDDPGHHDISGHVRRYLFVFLALLVGTVVTVAASYIPFKSSGINIAVALAIASVKATLVAAIFMHLSAERWTIYRFLIITVIFVIGLFALTGLAMSDRIHY